MTCCCAQQPCKGRQLLSMQGMLALQPPSWPTACPPAAVPGPQTGTAGSAGAAPGEAPAQAAGQVVGLNGCRGSVCLAQNQPLGSYTSVVPQPTVPYQLCTLSTVPAPLESVRIALPTCPSSYANFSASASASGWPPASRKERSSLSSSSLGAHCRRIMGAAGGMVWVWDIARPSPSNLHQPLGQVARLALETLPTTKRQMRSSCRSAPYPARTCSTARTSSAEANKAGSSRATAAGTSRHGAFSLAIIMPEGRVWCRWAGQVCGRWVKMASSRMMTNSLLQS